MITLQLPQDSKAKSIGQQQNLMRRPHAEDGTLSLPLAPDVISAEASIAKISFQKSLIGPEGQVVTTLYPEACP